MSGVGKGEKEGRLIVCALKCEQQNCAKLSESRWKLVSVGVKIRCHTDANLENYVPL